MTLLLLVAALLPLQAAAMRCGTRLVQEGDIALQVRDKCGDPISEEVIGYIPRGGYYHGISREREFKIEQWVYGPDKGYYHVLIFEGGRLRDIDKVRR
jgi:hypothetical protein